MKKYGKKILLLIIVLVLFVIIKYGNEYALRFKIIYNCYSTYHKEFSLHEVYIDNDESKISISFEGVDACVTDENIDIVADIYDKVFDLVYSNEKWSEYSLDITIKDVSQMTTFAIWNITLGKDSIEIFSSFEGISISGITQLCPEVSELSLISLEYEDITEFDNFTNLKSFSVSGDILDIDERTYILSRFPECELHWKTKK